MKFFVERPIATVMFYLASLILGVYSFMGTPLEIAPREDYPRVDIQAAWPGVSPDVIYGLVTAPLEEAAAAVKGVSKLNSESLRGVSRISLEFNRGADIEFSTLALREALAEIKARLPHPVSPVIQRFVPEDFRVRPFLRLMVSGQMPGEELRGILKDGIERELGSAAGVASVEISGGREPEIRISADPDKLQALKIHPDMINRALGQNLRAFAAGRIRRGGREHILKVRGPVQTIRNLPGTIVSHSGTLPVKISDFARCGRPAESTTVINRHNGRPAVMVTILNNKRVSALKTAREVKRKLARLKRELPPGLSFKIVDDEAAEIGKALGRLGLLAAAITGLVFLAVFILIKRIKPSLLILSSIVFSVVITLNLAYLVRISLNMLTLGALALGFGMFVDNSIVVFENILRLREKGSPPLEAAVRGSREVLKPVLISTLTTLCVFFSFPFFQGRLRVYYLPLAVVMASALTASFCVSFSLIPALSPFLLNIKRARREAARSSVCARFIRYLLGRRAGTLLIAAALLAGSFRWFEANVERGEFFHWHASERLAVSIRMPPGADIRQTDEAARKFEDKALETAGEKEVHSTVTADLAFISIDFAPRLESTVLPYALKEELIGLSARFAGLSIGIYGFDSQGYYAGAEDQSFSDSGISISGYNLKKLRGLAADLENSLRSNPRTRGIRTVASRPGSRRTDSPEYVLRLDRNAARIFRLDLPSLYSHLQAFLPGRLEAPLRAVIEGQHMDISLKFPGADSLTAAGLLDSRIPSGDGRVLRLKDIFTIEMKAAAGSIARENRRFHQTVVWEYRGSSKAAGAYQQALLAQIRLPPGFHACADEAWKITEEEGAQMKTAMVIALAAIFLILAAFYDSLLQPIYIMSAVPLSMIGVLAGFVIAGYPFDSSAYIGVILLSGIVVNNAILIVDNIGLKRHSGASLPDAVVHGTVERIRPMLMTASTTVLGTLPLLLIDIQAGKRQLWSTLALATVGGFVSSTFLLPAVIPVLCYLGERIRLRAAGSLKASVSRINHRLKSSLFFSRFL